MHAGMQLSKSAAQAVVLLAMTCCTRARYVLEVKGHSPPLAVPGLQPGVHEPVAGLALPHTVLHEPPGMTHNISMQRGFKLGTAITPAVGCA